jgi:hypothetical protein
MAIGNGVGGREGEERGGRDREEGQREGGKEGCWWVWELGLTTSDTRAVVERLFITVTQQQQQQQQQWRTWDWQSS